jgi:mono/diheme cytochrome c family protein
MPVKSAVLIAAAAAAFSIVALPTVVLPTRADDDAAMIEKGRALVTEKCARCHATGADDKSPHEKAPPFRDVVEIYPSENLAEALAEGIVSGHPDMPVFKFDPPEIEAFLGYLNSLSKTP